MGGGAYIGFELEWGLERDRQSVGVVLSVLPCSSTLDSDANGSDIMYSSGGSRSGMALMVVVALTSNLLFMLCYSQIRFPVRQARLFECGATGTMFGLGRGKGQWFI